MSLGILHVLWTGNIGGAERAVYQLVREQRRRGQRVAVLFGNAEGPYADRLRSEGCEVISLGVSRGVDPRMLAPARKAMAAYDLHHFHIVEPMLFLASSSIKRKARVFTQRAGIQQDASLAKKARYKSAGWFLRHRFHGWSGNNAYSTAALPKIYGVSPERVRTTYNGIDFSLLEPSRAAAEVRSDVGFTPADFVVGTTAFLKDWKRVDRLIEAAASAPSDVRVLVIGDGPERSNLEEKTRSLKLEDRVVFTGMKEDVVELVASLDAFVLPSNATEAFGNAVIEAMALGVPSAVFSDSPGICEHIDHGRTGFIVDDPRSLSELFNKLKADPRLRRSIGAAAAAEVRSRYAIGAAVDRYDNLYEEALRRQGRDGESRG